MKIIKLWFVYTKWFYAYRMQTYTIMTVTWLHELEKFNDK